MPRSKTLFLSLAGGFIIAPVLHLAAFCIDNRTISRVLLWQDSLFIYLTGPGPLLFVDRYGKPHFEGTPILVFILPVGYVISVLIYSVVTFVFLKAFVRRRASPISHDDSLACEDHL
jgi:hypothetical protein